MATSTDIRPVLPIEARRSAIQRIHTKLVSSKDLLELLRWMYGEDGFYVEMRHNVYTIARFRGPELDLKLLAQV